MYPRSCSVWRTSWQLDAGIFSNREMSESESGRFWSAKSSRKSRVRSTIFDILPANAGRSEDIQRRGTDQFENPASLAPRWSAVAPNRGSLKYRRLDHSSCASKSDLLFRAAVTDA